MDCLSAHRLQNSRSERSKDGSGIRENSDEPAARTEFSRIRLRCFGHAEVDKANNECSDVKELVDDKLQQVTEKIEELRTFQRSLKRLSNACCGGHESAEDCTILQALESETLEFVTECH